MPEFEYITVIDAYKCSDGTIYEDYAKAVDHQQDLQARAFLKLIDVCLPERYRNQLTHIDWFNIQKHVVEKAIRSTDVQTALKKLSDTLEVQSDLGSL